MKFKSIVISYNCVQLFWFYIFYLFLCTILLLVEWGEGGGSKAQSDDLELSHCQGQTVSSQGWAIIICWSLW